VATKALAHLGVDCVTLANNHALDFGAEALLDTIEHLDAAGIAHVGAGTDLAGARSPVVLEAAGFRLAVLGVADHPADFAADDDRPGIAFADLWSGVPDWMRQAILSARSEADAVLVTPHWGPNMSSQPVPHVRRTAKALIGAGATLVAGHSAHVFHGVDGPVLFDLGDFIDDYAVDPLLRNDLGLLFIVDLDPEGPRRLEGIPLHLDFCFTACAEGEDRAWVLRRFREACAAFGVEVAERGGRAVVEGW
jgi:poly-gamma-glutamate synthesis protein (capsule biosynthesis protein)